MQLLYRPCFLTLSPYRRIVCTMPGYSFPAHRPRKRPRDLLYGKVPCLSLEIRPRQGVAAGEEPPPQRRPESGLGCRVLQAGAQLVQEWRPLAVGHDLELGCDGSVQELAPTPCPGADGPGR